MVFFVYHAGYFSVSTSVRKNGHSSFITELNWSGFIVLEDSLIKITELKKSIIFRKDPTYYFILNFECFM